MTSLRLGIGLGILLFLFARLDWQQLSEVLRASAGRWPWLTAAAGIGFAQLLLGAWRWKLILDAGGLRLAWRRVLAISFIGQFFNAFFFGSTGGDLARAYYAAAETHRQKTEAVATVVIDRAVGFVLLNAIALAMLITRWDFYLRHRVAWIPALIMIGLNAATAAGLAALAHIERVQTWPGFRRLVAHRVLGPIFRRTLASYRLYRQKPGALFHTAWISLAINGLVVAQAVCLGLNLQVNLSLLDYLAVIPLVVAISALPITPGGLGVREGLSVAFLTSLGVSRAQSLPMSLLFTLIAYAWSLLGGLWFLGYRSGATRAAPAGPPNS